MSNPRTPSDQPYQGYPPPPQENQAPYQPPGSQPPYQPSPGQQAPYGQPGYQPSDQIIRSADMGGAQSESRYAAYRDAEGNRIERRQQVYRDKNQQRANLRNLLTTIIYTLLGIVEVILALRLFFRLLGANTDNSFITFLYGLSHFFVAPFNGIFNDQALGKQGVFEWSTVTAMIIYALLAWGIVALINIILRPQLNNDQTFTTTRHQQDW